jgi:PKD repeat protein/disulfide oxidoreductase YuzD
MSTFSGEGHNGQTYTSNAVTLRGASGSGWVSGAEPNPRTVQIDVSTLTPGTVVTLYFDLLGFGAKTSSVTIDDVQLLAELSQAPITQNDSATTNQNTAITVDVLSNDRDPDGTLITSTLLIAQAPQHGKVSINPNGTVTYQPTANYIGNDQFTYLIQDNSGVYSSPATVSLSILNPIPTINQVNIDSTLSEGTPAQLSATATIAGNQPLTYTWTFGDNTPPAQGQNIQHTYANNGTYTLTLTVNSGSNTPAATIQRTLTVNNIAPTVDAGLDKAANEGQTIAFNGTYTDPGILDTQTITWNFGDGTAPITGTLTPTHIYADNGTYTVSLTVTDNDGAVTTDNLIVTIKNVAPTITNLSGPIALNEGQIATFSATATDAGANDTLTYTWNFGDSTAPVIGQSVTHTFADNGTYPVLLTVTDKDGASTTQTLNVQVANVAPTVDAGLDKTANEGQTVQLNGTYTDPGILDTQTISWNFGDGSAPTIGTLTPTHIYADNGTYTVSLTVIDKDGGSATDTLVVTVKNVAPTITNLTGPITLNEGQSATFSATATDPGTLDTLTYSWNLGDGSPVLAGPSIAYTYKDNGTYSILLTVTDKDGASTTQTLNVQVANVAPTVDAGLDKTSNEGQTVTFGGTYTDPGILDTQTIVWNFGDSSAPTIGTLTPTHIYADNGTYTVSLTVTDKDGGSTTDTLVVTVKNVAPTITNLTGPITLNEGQIATYSATATDPGTSDTLIYTWNFGSGTVPVTGQSVTHTFADNGTYPVVLTVTDKDGSATTQTLTVQVANVAPTVDAGLDKTANEGQTVQLNGTYTDPGILDTQTLTWNFGDGSTPTTGTLTPSHIYKDNGTYTVSLTVTDKDGGSTTDTLVMTVKNVAPTITNLTGPITLNEGQSATFSATATDPGTLDTLTYSWNFGNGTVPVTGQSIAYTFKDNGTYPVVLTVTDKDGAATTQTLTVKVANVAPTVDAGADRTITQGQPLTLSGTYTDPGILDTQTITWNFGDGSTPITGTLTPNYTYAASGTYIVTLTVTDKDGGSSSNTLVATVKALPTLAISDQTLTEGDSGTTTLTFTVSLSAASSQPVTVNYATANGTAIAGSDYTATSGTLTFAAGQTTQTLSVQVIGDKVYEPTETFFINLSSATNATIADAQAVATILDNDPMPPALTINDQTITEGDCGTKTLTFTVSLSRTSTSSVTVQYSTANGTATAGSDYTATSGTLTFNPGQTTQTIAVQVIGDKVYEGTETFFINLTSPTNALISDAQGVATILENDPAPTLTINDQTITEGDSGTKLITFTVTLSGSSTLPVSVDYATANGTAIAGSDYTATSGTLTFAAGQTTQTITVQVIGDKVYEGTETFFINLINVANATLADAQAIATILDNDPIPPAIRINDRTITEGANGTKTLTFTVSLDQCSSQPVTVNYATADGTATAGSDYIATSGTLTFAAGQTTQTISVQIKGDGVVEADETFFLNLSNATNAIIADAQGVATIQNDDAVPTLCVSVQPNVLWPPNHQMVEITPTIQVNDDVDCNPVVSLVSIASSEPDNGLGDGDTANDIQIINGRIYLRAERSGSGNGRVYTLTYSARDSAGNITYATTQVSVPKSKGK